MITLYLVKEQMIKIRKAQVPDLFALKRKIKCENLSQGPYWMFV
jgi:hypothetical protein